MATIDLDTEDRISRATTAMEGLIEIMMLVPPGTTIAVNQVVAIYAVVNDELNRALPKQWRAWGANDDE